MAKLKLEVDDKPPIKSRTTMKTIIFEIEGAIFLSIVSFFIAGNFHALQISFCSMKITD
jgi:hypothetical protein